MERPACTSCCREALGFAWLSRRRHWLRRVRFAYGKLVFAGLVLGALGDVFLLGSARQFFIGGLVSFLLGHLAYVVAFASLGMDGLSAAATALIMAVALSLDRSLGLSARAQDARSYRGYMLVIGLMCVCAIGAAGAGAPWMIPVGALMFTASDIAVVRDRFISKGFVNRAWGLPLYYAAQLLIAWSIRAVGA